LHSAAQTDLEEAEAEKRNAAFKVPVETPAANNLNSNAAPHKNRSLSKAIGIAAAIAILAGGGFAGWYAMNGPNVQSDNFQPRQTQTVHKNEAQKPETSDAKQNANTAFVITASPEPQPSNTSVKSPVIPPAPLTEAKPSAQTVIVEKAEKQTPAQSKPNVQNKPQIKVTVGEADTTEDDDVNDDFPNIRPEDIPGISAEEREELRQALKIRNQFEIRRKALEKVNRRRAEKGLPPLNPPPPPGRKPPQDQR
jgi:cytoskeletal protein RodZ